MCQDFTRSLQILEIIATCRLKAKLSKFWAVSFPDPFSCLLLPPFSSTISWNHFPPPPCHRELKMTSSLFWLSVAASWQNYWTEMCHPMHWAPAPGGIFQTLVFLKNIIGSAAAVFPENIPELGLVSWHMLCKLLPDLWTVMSLHKTNRHQILQSLLNVLSFVSTKMSQ